MPLRKKNWDVGNIASQINSISRESADPHNDGFTSLELKKDLYIIKELIHEALQRCPNFGTIEEEWLTDREKQRIIKILKD